MNISIIVAQSSNRVIGKNNKLMWHLPADLRYFKRTTSGHCVIMGRKTHESIGMLLPGRTNIVISRQADYQPLPGAKLAQSLQQALDMARDLGEQEAFVIGGGEIYQETMPLADRLYVTEVQDTFNGDTFFPEISPQEWEEVSRFDMKADKANIFPYAFVVYQRVK